MSAILVADCAYAVAMLIDRIPWNTGVFGLRNRTRGGLSRVGFHRRVSVRAALSVWKSGVQFQIRRLLFQEAGATALGRACSAGVSRVTVGGSPSFVRSSALQLGLGRVRRTVGASASLVSVVDEVVVEVVVDFLAGGRELSATQAVVCHDEEGIQPARKRLRAAVEVGVALPQTRYR